MWCLFLGICMLDAHFLCGDCPGILIGQDIFILGQGAYALPGRNGHYKTMLKHVVCLNDS
jgi:hypothetical protein